MFSGCSNLVTITLPVSVTCVEEYAFSNCTKLTSVSISKQVQNIENNVFSGCLCLSSINFDGTQDEWNAIKKEEGWDAGIGFGFDSKKYTVYCTDGNIAKQ